MSLAPEWPSNRFSGNKSRFIIQEMTRLALICINLHGRGCAVGTTATLYLIRFCKLALHIAETVILCQDIARAICP